MNYSSDVGMMISIILSREAAEIEIMSMHRILLLVKFQQLF